jgi:two-component system sensor histidine kinase KdpD
VDLDVEGGVEAGQSSGGPARGRHKIFLGYAAGVGKTYTMLSEARRRVSRGEDVVIGFVEPHKRPETIALTEGLERVETKKVDYRGGVFEELDTDAVIARRPEWVLVDELAHTNVPGTRHEKRWQSVDEILGAGINVISTVNVQHFESLNDTVGQITKVSIRETVPDRILDEADEVVLVDITPDALINRIKRGVVYEEAKVPQALSHFFRRGNLVALRELALRKTAEEVDEELERFIATHDVDKTWGAADHVLVAVTARPGNAKLIRRGYRLARRMAGDLWVVHVRPAGALLEPVKEEALDTLRDLANELGGHFISLSGDDVAREIIDFAKSHQITFIVLGQSARSRMDEILHGSIVTRIMRETRNIDVVIVADDLRATDVE